MRMDIGDFKEKPCPSNAKCQYLPGQSTALITIDGNISLVYILTNG